MKYWHEQKTKRNAVVAAILADNPTFYQAIINIVVFGGLGVILAVAALMVI